MRHVGCGGPILPVGKQLARVQVRDNRLTFRPGASGLEPVFGHGRVFRQCLKRLQAAQQEEVRHDQNTQGSVFTASSQGNSGRAFRDDPVLQVDIWKYRGTSLFTNRSLVKETQVR